MKRNFFRNIQYQKIPGTKQSTKSVVMYSLCNATNFTDVSQSVGEKKPSHLVFLRNYWAKCFPCWQWCKSRAIPPKMEIAPAFCWVWTLGFCQWRLLTWAWADHGWCCSALEVIERSWLNRCWGNTVVIFPSFTLNIGDFLFTFVIQI